jgi:hypothetical protein
MGRGITRAVLAALTLGLAAGSADAQVGPNADVYILGRPGPDRGDYDRPRRPPSPDDLYDRPRRPPPPPPDDGYDWPRRPPPPPPDDLYDRPRYRERYRVGRPRWGDSVCVTARGTCLTPPGPPNAPCGCEIPGFGYKRGQIGY